MSIIRRIRKTVFGMNQTEFAAVAGVAQSTVSRWEKQGVAPTLDEMRAIRAAASERRLRWNDKWFFEGPPAPSQPERAA